MKHQIDGEYGQEQEDKRGGPGQPAMMRNRGDRGETVGPVPWILYLAVP